MLKSASAPLRKSTRKEKSLAAKPWITRGILTSIKIKNKMYKELLTNNTTQQKTIFKIYRNKLTHIKEQAKKLYFNQQIKESQHNTGLLWKTINDIISLKKIKAENNINITNEEGNFIANPQQKSNSLITTLFHLVKIWQTKYINLHLVVPLQKHHFFTHLPTHSS